MSVQNTIASAEDAFSKAVQHLEAEFSRLQIGRASAALVENIKVHAYGSDQPVKAVGNITIPEPRTLMIQPWDKTMLAAIEKGIVGAGIGLNPVNDGNVVRINIPVLTEERRKDLTKRVHQLAEEAKIRVRTARQDAHNAFKRMKTESEITEDDLHDADKKLQTKVDNANSKIDEVAKAKENDIMTI
jgi:ribosome recycling factor